MILWVNLLVVPAMDFGVANRALRDSFYEDSLGEFTSCAGFFIGSDY